MAKRNVRRSSSKKSTRLTDSDLVKALEQQVVDVAEQLGRIAAIAQARADQWLGQQRFQAKLARIRERTSQLLGRLSAASAKADRDRRAREREKSREKVAAPGKKRRKAPKPSPGIKHSDEGISKALATRRRKSARPRQG